MADTPNYAIPLLTEGQASGEVTHNDAVVRLAALMHLNVLDRDLTAPPGGESNGDRYLVKATATGDWATHDDEIALYYNGWIFIVPVDGMIVFVNDEDVLLDRKAAAWSTITVT